MVKGSGASPPKEVPGGGKNRIVCLLRLFFVSSSYSVNLREEKLAINDRQHYKTTKTPRQLVKKVGNLKRGQSFQYMSGETRTYPLSHQSQ